MQKSETHLIHKVRLARRRQRAQDTIQVASKIGNDKAQTWQVCIVRKESRAVDQVFECSGNCERRLYERTTPTGLRRKSSHL